MEALLPHPGKILKVYFEEKQRQNLNYSLRALARDLKLSPAFVSQIFSGRRAPSLAAMQSFVRVLKVRRSDAEVLRKSVVLHSRENKEIGKILGEYLRRDPSTVAFKRYSRKNFDSLHSLTQWHQFALMELITCAKYQSDERLIAKKLRLPLLELRANLFTLVNAGLIERENGKWVKKSLHYDFPTDTSHEATRQYHRTMTSKALEVLMTELKPEDIERRRMIGATLAVNPEKLRRAIDELNNFLYKLAAQLSEGECREVYQLNLQLFPLTEAEKS